MSFAPDAGTHLATLAFLFDDTGTDGEVGDVR
jgi:hypothetical protein